MKFVFASLEKKTVRETPDITILFILLIGATDSALSRLMGLISLKEAYRNNINSYL